MGKSMNNTIDLKGIESIISVKSLACAILLITCKARAPNSCQLVGQIDHFYPQQGSGATSNILLPPSMFLVVSIEQ